MSNVYAASRARRADAATQAGADASRGRLVYTVQVSCLLCGRPVAELVSDSWPLPSEVTIRPVGAMPQSGVGWRDLRCEVCGGNTWLGDVETEWVHPPVDWSSIRPRVGRPPKRLAQALSRAQGPAGPLADGRSLLTDGPLADSGPLTSGGLFADDWLAPPLSSSDRAPAGRRLPSWRAPRCPPRPAQRAGPGP